MSGRNWRDVKADAVASGKLAPTLTEFLLARVAEDEEAAREGAGEPAYFHYGDTAAEESVAMAKSEGCAPGGYRHLRRWLPERVLAECEAKRRIVTLHQETVRRQKPYGDVLQESYCSECREHGPCPTLYFLALPYADHPDYREEWMP